MLAESARIAALVLIGWLMSPEYLADPRRYRLKLRHRQHLAWMDVVMMGPATVQASRRRACPARMHP
jgi:hypothetical protein